MTKDVGEYFDDLEDLWRDRDVWAEPIPPEEYIFAYDEEADPPYSRGHVLARITFPRPDPDDPEAYLKADEWLVAVGDTHIRRESYVYEFIWDGAMVENWHRHRESGGGTDPAHTADHQHRDDRRTVGSSVTHQEAIDACLRILWSGDVDRP